MKGRPAKPTALKVLLGNPGKRALNAEEPVVPPGVPTCPAHLSPDAKAEWRRIVRVLKTMNLITHVDRAVLAAYCQAWGRWVEAEATVMKEGMVLTDLKGDMKAHPCVGIAERAMGHVKQMCVEFGMTPSSRSRIHMSHPQQREQDTAKKYFGT